MGQFERFIYFNICTIVQETAALHRQKLKNDTKKHNEKNDEEVCSEIIKRNLNQNNLRSCQPSND